MPNLTPNYNLKKPIKATENADIDVINGNMDILDTELKKSNDNISILKNQIKIVNGYVMVKGRWTKESENLYTYIFNDIFINSNTVVNLNLDPTSIQLGFTNGIQPYTLSGNGFAKFFSTELPKGDVGGNIPTTIEMIKGV